MKIIVTIQIENSLLKNREGIHVHFMDGNICIKTISIPGESTDEQKENFKKECQNLKELPLFNSFMQTFEDM